MNHVADIHIGTSGYNYRHWRGVFYPENLPQKNWLRFYADRFHTVEINNSFYQLPAKSTFQRWRDSTPDGFVFSVKASRYITHMKKLKDPDLPISSFLSNARGLEEKLGPILFQLPPRWHCNVNRLVDFVQVLPKEYRYSIEFRDDSWWNSEVYSVLVEHNIAFCIFDINRVLSPKEVTADFVYVRLHGPQGAYQGQYDAETLAGWAGAFNTWAAQRRDIFCYFDNDQFGFAVEDALRLQDMLN
jgi:uncharacterized protein YecE (DUF72 family)